MALESFGRSTNVHVWFLSKDSISCSMAIIHLLWSPASIASLQLSGSHVSVTNAKETWSSFQQYLVGGNVTLTDRLNSLGRSSVATCSSPSEYEEFSSDSSGFLGLAENPNFLFLSIYQIVWTSTLRFILHLWLFLQYWFFVKDHISADKGTPFLGITKSKILDSFGEPNGNTLLRFGLQFVPFLTVNQAIRRATENLYGWIVHRLSSSYLL